tara:strand:- start:3907 stop:4173 length:267 start_codon:yes stop_codon:yes gene_type:complete
MNIFTSQKEMKKWAISMANACGGQEVTQTSIKLNNKRPDKVQFLTQQFVSDYNSMMEQAIKLAEGKTKLKEVDNIESAEEGDNDGVAR